MISFVLSLYVYIVVNVVVIGNIFYFFIFYKCFLYLFKKLICIIVDKYYIGIFVFILLWKELINGIL